MVYKLGHEAEIGSLPFQMSGKLYDNLVSDWVTSISHDPDYCDSVYFLRDDYVVVLVRAQSECRNG